MWVSAYFFEREYEILFSFFHKANYVIVFYMMSVLFVNSAHGSGLFLYPLKTSEKRRFFDVFRGCKERQWHEMGWRVKANEWLQRHHFDVLFFLITLKKNSHNTLLSLLSLNITSRTYLFKCKNKIICEICSKLTVKAPERHHWYHPGVFIVNFEQISHTTLVFP